MSRRGAFELSAALLAVTIVLIVAAAVPWLRFVLTITTAKGIAVLGILLLLRAGQVSFGHALYVALAAYTVAFAAARIPEVAVLVPLGIAVSTIAGLVVGLFVTRYREIFFGMLNLAISMVCYSVLEKFYALTHGSDGMRLPPVTFAGRTLDAEQSSHVVLVLALAIALGCGILVRAYLNSPIGHALSAVKTRETRLEFMGIPARRVLLVAYVLSAGMAGIAGVLIALSTRHVTPALSYWTASAEFVFIGILGGAGSVFGPFLGAVGYELTRVYAAALVADAWQMILGGVLLLIILFAPHGIWGMGRAIVSRWRAAS